MEAIKYSCLIDGEKLEILYPQDLHEVEILDLISHIEKLISTNKIVKTVILNTEISVRLFLYLIGLTKNGIELYVPKKVYDQFTTKKSALDNLTDIRTDLIKVIHEQKSKY
jgi:hypothetical protein